MLPDSSSYIECGSHVTSETSVCFVKLLLYLQFNMKLCFKKLLTSKNSEFLQIDFGYKALSYKYESLRIMLLLLQELEDTVVSCLTVPGFMQLLEAGGSRHDVLYGFTERYVEAYIRDRPEELEVHDVVKKAAAKLQSVFAAIVVMLNPIPGIFGTTPAAVSLIVENTDKTNGFLNAVSTVMTNHAFWQKQLDDCLLKGPASMKACQHAEGAHRGASCGE